MGSLHSSLPQFPAPSLKTKGMWQLLPIKSTFKLRSPTFGRTSDESVKHPASLLTLLPVWLALIAIGLSLLWSYEDTPGVAAAPPNRWPSASRIKPSPGQATLVMLTHPQCPCTRASIEELDKLMAHCRGRLKAYVVVIKPDGAPINWEDGKILRSALTIPDVSVLVDQNGVEARRFHAETSGQVVLYNPEGNLLFSGGITASRGQAGDNAGETAIESLVNAGSASSDRSFVFGCPLFNPNSECRKGAYETVKD